VLPTLPKNLEMLLCSHNPVYEIVNNHSNDYREVYLSGQN